MAASYNNGGFLIEEGNMFVFACPVCQHVLQVTPHSSPMTVPPAPPIPNGAVAAAEDDQLRTKLVNLKARCTRTTGKVWELVQAVAARPQPCTRQELAMDLAAPPKKILAWRRILGRCCHPRRLNISVIQRTHDGKYEMSDDMRGIITELG